MHVHCYEQSVLHRPSPFLQIRSQGIFPSLSISFLLICLPSLPPNCLRSLTCVPILFYLSFPPSSFLALYLTQCFSLNQLSFWFLALIRLVLGPSVYICSTVILFSCSCLCLFPSLCAFSVQFSVSPLLPFSILLLMLPFHIQSL